MIEPTSSITHPGKLWWDDDFFYRRPLTLTTTSIITYDNTLTKVVKLTLDTTSLITDGKLRPDGKDLRVAYWDGLAWSELARVVQNPNAVTTTVLFPLNATITDTVVNAYWLYYGNAVPNPAPVLMEDYGQAAELYILGEDEETSGVHVDFMAEPITGLAPLEVTLTNLTFPEPTGYEWDFGDGDTATLTDTTHIYQTPGVYTVSLTMITDTITSTLAQPGLIWVAGLDVSNQVTANLGSLEETPVVSATVTTSLTETQVITSAEGILSVAFPPGAAPQDLIVTHTPYQAFVKQGSGLLTRFELTAQTSGGQPVTQFSQPLTFTLDLNRFNLTDELARTSIFLTWDETLQKWEPISTTLDLNQGLLYGQVDHFTEFMAFVSARPGGPPSIGAVLPSSVADAASGAATFAIPIEVPPGTAGMQPVISIGYSSLQAQAEMIPDSNEVPGLLGSGTFLNLSYIARSNQNSDRELDEIYMDHYFLVMNGRSQKLIPDGDEYRTEDETFWRIRRISDSCSNGADADCNYWEVTTKDGTRYIFGQTTDSIQKAMATDLVDGKYQLFTYPGRYYLNRVQDVNGNSMLFEYDNNTSATYTIYRPNSQFDVFELIDVNYDMAVYLTRIDYTINDETTPTLSPQRMVEFGYAERTINNTTDFLGPNAYNASQSFYYDRRLQTITTTVDSNLVRRYDFNSTYLANSKILILQGVSMKGVGGSTTFDLTTRFDYYDQSEDEDSEFGLLRRVDTVGSTTEDPYNSVEYFYEPHESFPLLGFFIDKVQLVSQQILTATETSETQTLSYDYKDTIADPRQGTVAKVSGSNVDSSSGGVVPGYWRASLHDSLSGRTSVQAFYTRRVNETNPLAGRLAWTEVFTDPDNDCAKITSQGPYYQAIYLCPPEGYLTGQYLAYQHNSTVEGGEGTATFVAPAIMIQAIGPLASGQPHDWTKIRYDYETDTGNVSRLWEFNNPENGQDGRVTEFSYTSPPNDEVYIFRPDIISIYSTVDEEDFGPEISSTYFNYNYDTERPAALDQVTQRIFPNPTDPYGSEPALASTITFDDLGNVTQSEGAAGNYQVEYDPVYFTFPMTTTYPTAAADVLTTTAIYNPAFGLTTQTTAMNGAVTEYQYDAFGRIISATNQATGASTTYSYDYLATGLTLTTTQVDGPDGLSSQQHYNGLGQLKWERHDGENGSIQVDYNYAQRRLTGVSVPHLGETPSLWTRYEYDDWDRPTVITHPDETTRQQTQYAGWSQQKFIDENQHVTVYTRDALGRVTQVQAYTGTLGSEALYSTTVYTYNAQGQVTDMLDDTGNLTHMEYDGAGRTTILDDPDTGHWEYKYTSSGPLTWQMSPEGGTLNFAYDNQKRLIQIWKDELEASPKTFAEFTYDTGENGQGQRASMLDASGHTTYGYDAGGRLITETREIDGISYQTGFTYDSLNRVETLTYPDGEVMTYTYNNQGLLAGLTTTPGDLSITSTTYNALGQLTQLTGANGLNWQFGYYDQTNQALKQAMLMVGSTSLSFTYGYNDAGYLTNLSGNAGSVSLDMTYNYDPLNRLTGVTDNEGSFNLSRVYTYDPQGSLLSKDGLAYSYNNPNNFPAHAPSQTGNFNFEYDANGNRSQRSEGSLEVNYSYDQLNRLAYVISDTAVISGSAGGESVTQAVYDGDGQRVKRITAEGTTVTIGQHYEVFYPASFNETLPTASNCPIGNILKSPFITVNDSGDHRYIVFQAILSLGTPIWTTCEYDDTYGQTFANSSGWTPSIFDLEADNQGTSYQLWSIHETFDNQEYLRLGGVPVSISSIPQMAGNLAVDGNGTAHMVWTEDQTLYYAQVSGSTVISSQIPISIAAGSPQVATDGNGTAHIVWIDNMENPVSGFWEPIIRHQVIGGGTDTIPTATCPFDGGGSLTLAVDAAGTAYVAWKMYDPDFIDASQPICFAIHEVGNDWVVTTSPYHTPMERLLLKAAADGTIYLARGSQAPLPEENPQATLYLDRYQAGVWQTALVNTYPTETSLLAGDMDLDAAGNAHFAWIDDRFFWEEDNGFLALRAAKVVSTTIPQITKYYYANGQRVATRVDNDLYYTLSDPTGHAALFADSAGQEVGYILYDSFGGVVTSTLPTTLTTKLAGHLDPTGLQYDGQRYFDPLTGNYIQPSAVGGVLAPQVLNRYGITSGEYPAYLPSPRGNGGISPLVADAGESFLSNSASALIGNWLEPIGDLLPPISGRLAAAAVGDWQWLRIRTYHFANGWYRAGIMAEFFQYQWFGPFKYHNFTQDAYGNGLHEALVRRLPDEADSLAKSLSRSGASVSWEPVFGPAAGRVWNYSFGLSRSPKLAGLAEHFTVGKFTLGIVADIAVGGIVQGVKDYDLWSRDPWLATRRASAAGGANATVGLIGGGTTAIGFSLLVGAGMATPPGWVIVGTSIVVTVGFDLWIGDAVKENWFQVFDAGNP